MPHKKPQPLNSSATQNACPVCGQTSYSRGGVHPQCSVKLADASRVESMKRDKTVTTAAKPARSVTRWQKTCPKCKVALHVRKKACDCGYEFPSQSNSATGENRPK